VSYARAPADASHHEGEKDMIAHSDLVYALSQLDSFIDVSEEDLVRIYTLAVHHTHDHSHIYTQSKSTDSKVQNNLQRPVQAAETA
jgi:hypothetical protein